MVSVVAEGADGRRKGGDESTESAALFCSGVADLRLVHAVFPNEVRGDFRRGSEFQETAEAEAESPFFLIEGQCRGMEFEGGFRLALRGG